MKAKTVNVMENVLSSLGQMFNREMAVKIVNYRLDKPAQKRIEVLAKKANFGTLTESEHREYEKIVEMLDIVAILQCEARGVLKRSESPA